MFIRNIKILQKQKSSLITLIFPDEEKIMMTIYI